MAFRPRRQSRKNTLLGAHFLPIEAHTLSSVSLRLPHMRAMIKARKAEYRQALRRDISRTQYERDIKARYRKNGWLVTEAAVTRKGTIGYLDPWAMYRAWRQASIDSGDYVVPPSKKKGKDGRRVLDTAQAEAKRKGKNADYLSKLSQREIRGY